MWDERGKIGCRVILKQKGSSRFSETALEADLLGWFLDKTALLPLPGDGKYPHQMNDDGPSLIG